jgi:hypothetical protein
MTVARNAEGAGPMSEQRHWPLTGAIAGLLGVIATLVTDLRTKHTPPTAAQVLQLDRGAAWTGVMAGYACIACLIVFSAQWRQFVENRENCVSARVVSLGITASAGALTLGYGWKGALAVYLPGGMDEAEFDQSALFIYYVLNDFGAYLGWLGVTVSAGAVAWMSLVQRLMVRWIGFFSTVVVLIVVAWVCGTGLPGFSGVIGPAWLLVICCSMAFGRGISTRV